MHHFKDIHESNTIISLNYLFTSLGDILSVTIASNGSFIVSSSADKSIKILDFRAKQVLHHFDKAHVGIVTSCLLSK